MLLPVGEQNVISWSNVSLILTNCDTQASVEIQCIFILDTPTRCTQAIVYQVARDLFWGLVITSGKENS